MLITPEVLVASPKETKALSAILKQLKLSMQLEFTGSAVLGHLRGNTPQLIILNAELPEITGTSIAYRIKKVKRLADVPVILLVDAKQAKLRAEAEMSGVDRIVHTPFSAVELKGLIANYVPERNFIPEEQAEFVLLNP